MKHETATPVDPKDLVGDAWMNDAVASAEFHAGLKAMDREIKPLTDAIAASERLTAADFAVRINARDLDSDA